MNYYILKHISSFQNGLHPNMKLTAKLFIFNIFPETDKIALVIIKYLHINNLLRMINFDYINYDYDEYTLADRLICNGNLNTLKWLHENTNITPKKGSIDIALTYGQLKIAMWLKKNFE
jgi:hypothetical protein